MNLGSAVLAGSLLVLAFAGLAGKVELGHGSTAAGRSHLAESAAAEDLRAAGWEVSGDLVLTAGGRYRVREFRTSACDGALFMTAVVANGETDTMLQRLAGADGRVWFVQGGRMSERPNLLRAYLLSKVGRLAADGSYEPIAVAVTGGCARTGPLPWPANP